MLSICFYLGYFCTFCHSNRDHRHKYVTVLFCSIRHDWNSHFYHKGEVLEIKISPCKHVCVCVRACVCVRVCVGVRGWVPVCMYVCVSGTENLEA